MAARVNGARRTIGALLILFAAFVAAVVPVAAQRPNGAGLVVRFDDGSLVYAYVQFEEESISSEALLVRSGLSVVVAPYGGLGSGICKIQDTGCPSDDCFCASYSQPAYFWHFYSQSDSGWAEQLSGASAETVGDGDIDGWSWTAADAGLPSTTIEEIATLNGIDLSDPTPTLTPIPTETATTPATATPAPTAPPPAVETATEAARSTLEPTAISPTPTTAAEPATLSPTATQPAAAISATPTEGSGSSANSPTTEPSATTRTATTSTTPSRATATATALQHSVATATLAATLTATLGPTTVAVLVPPDGTPVALVPDEAESGSAGDYAMFGALAAVVVAGGAAVVYRNRKAA